MSLRGGNGEDGGVVSGTDAVAAVVGEDCRADFEGEAEGWEVTRWRTERAMRVP